MVWAALVAGGVAIVCMAIFAARLTRRDAATIDEIVPAADPSDPWAAWQPRPFEDLDRPARPRLWPVLTSLTGLVLVGGGLAGARQNVSGPDALASASTPKPFLIEVEMTPSPTPIPTPAPTPAPTRKPAAATSKPAGTAAAPAASTAGAPTLTGSASCAEGKAKVSFVATGQGGRSLTYVGIYLDGKVVGGGPINSNRYESTVERTATPGVHSMEVSVKDSADRSSRKQWQVRCA